VVWEARCVENPTPHTPSPNTDDLSLSHSRTHFLSPSLSLTHSHFQMMASLYMFTLYTGYQGLQWRTLRSVGDDMKPLQVSTVTQVNRGSTFALRRSTLDVCLSGQRFLYFRATNQ